MRDRLSNGAWQANASRSWSAISMNGARTTAGARPVAASRDAMQRADTASHLSDVALSDSEEAKSETAVNPAGVSERQVGRQSADQTPAGGGRQSGAQVTLRIRRVVAMPFSPKGSFARYARCGTESRWV